MDTDHADPEYAGQLHHVELYATDFEAAIEFWGWILPELGYEPKHAWEEGRSWEHGPTYIVIEQADCPEKSFERQCPGLNHLAFHGQSREQVDTLTATVRERDDATVLYDDRHPYAGGYYALYCESPEGIKVEIVAPE